MAFDNPIVGGIVLLIPAIQSPNYVAGTSGWKISQDGSAEFNNAIIRGELDAGNGAVTVKSTGLAVTSPTSTETETVSPQVGFVSMDSDGSTAQIAGLNGSGGLLTLYPPRGPNNVTWNPGGVKATDSQSGASDQGILTVNSPATGSFAEAQVQLGSRSSANPTSFVDLVGDQIQFNGSLQMPSEFIGQATITPSAANTPTALVVTFPALQGSIFTGFISLSTSVPGTTVTGCAITAVSATGCTLWVTRTNTTNTIVYYWVKAIG